MDPTSYHYWLSQYQLEEQQALPSLSIQQRFISAAIEFTSCTGIANSNTNNSDPNHGHRNDTQRFEQQQLLPGLSGQQQYIPVETGFTRSMNDTINYDNSSRIPHAHHYDNQLYQPQPSLSGTSTEQGTEAAETYLFMPLQTTEHNTNYSSQYLDSRNFNQFYQQQQLLSPGPTQIQPIRPTASTHSDVATSNTNYVHLHQTQACDFMLQQEQPSLPRPILPGPVVPGVTFDAMYTGDSARQSSYTDLGLSVSSRLVFPTAPPTQPPHVRPAPLVPARPEQQEIHVAPSLVSNSPRLVIIHIIVTYEGVEV
jgi:hypothetical protein